MTSADDTRIRGWAARQGYDVAETGPIPETIRERYEQARAYMIRKSYARRNRNAGSEVIPVRSPFIFRALRD